MPAASPLAERAASQVRLLLDGARLRAGGGAELGDRRLPRDGRASVPSRTPFLTMPVRRSARAASASRTGWATARPFSSRIAAAAWGSGSATCLAAAGNREAP